MIKNIVAMSCLEAVQYVFYNRIGGDKFAIISIQEFETDGNGFLFTETGCCKKVLTLNFSDVDPGIFAKYNETEHLQKLISENKCKVFDKKDAKKIKDFMKEIQKDEEIKTLIVHCSAGVSRSPAVAAAIHNKLFGNPSHFFETQVPNKYIYSLLLENL